MSKSSRGINYGKWSVILGIPIALVSAISAVVAFPDIGCRVGLNLPSCDIPLQKVELFTQSEKGEFLAGVKIQFMAKGAPEVQYTDNNGYAKVQMPSRGDVRVNLSKAGYPVQEFTINLENPQPPVRLIRFTQSGQPEIQPVSSLPPSPTSDPSPTSSSSSVVPKTVPSATTSSSSSQEQEGFLFQLVDCNKRSDQLFVCDLEVKNLQESSRELTLWTGGSRIIDSKGNEIPSVEARLGSRTGTGNASAVFPSNVSINGSVSFNGIPKGDVVLIGLNFSAGQRLNIEFRPNKQYSSK